MTTIFDFCLDVIRVDLIIGFGWYSIFFFIFRVFKYKNESLVEFDSYACKTVVFLGITFGIIWCLASGFNYLYVLNDDQKTRLFQRATGPYWFGYWLQPLFFIAWTQLVRIRFVRRFLLFRIIICFLFVLSFEQFVIIVTMIHRDYLPVSWGFYNVDLGFGWGEFLLSILGKTAEFVIVVFACKFLQQSIGKPKTIKAN